MVVFYRDKRLCVVKNNYKIKNMKNFLFGGFALAPLPRSFVKWMQKGVFFARNGYKMPLFLQRFSLCNGLAIFWPIPIVPLIPHWFMRW